MTVVWMPHTTSDPKKYLSVYTFTHVLHGDVFYYMLRATLDIHLKKKRMK